MPIAACEQAALSKSEENGQEEAALTILPPKSFLPTLPPIKINPASRDHEWLTFFCMGQAVNNTGALFTEQKICAIF